jgi:hypothetical protein
MPRPKGSKNKLTPEFYRSYFDIQQLYYPGTKKKPIQWFERLDDISSRMVYIVVPKELSNSSTTNFKKYLNNRIEPLSNDILISKSGNRNNDDLKVELHEFYLKVTSFYLDELANNAGDVIRISEIKSEIKQIQNIITKALKKSEKRIYSERVFYLATKGDLVKPLKKIPHIKKKIDHDIVLRNLASWEEFWKANIPHIVELYSSLYEKPAFVRQRGDNNQNNNYDFNLWLEKGIKKYLLSTSDKISSPETKKHYLKHLILNKPVPKKKNI